MIEPDKYNNNEPVSLPVDIDRNDPLKLARFFHQTNLVDKKGNYLVAYYASIFCRFVGYKWIPQDSEQSIKTLIWLFLEKLSITGKNGEIEFFKPNRRIVQDVYEALKAIADIGQHKTAPFWLDDRDTDASKYIPLSNGLYNISESNLEAIDPNLFTFAASPVPLLDTTGTPIHWLEFLESIWSGDPKSIDTLQEIFGYLLTADTDQQKMFLIIGPRRGGKGTIAWVQKELFGHQNVVGPTLSGLSGPFGLQALIGKSVAIIGDARLGYKTDHGIVTERLLSISGEDILTVDRKFQEPWTGKLSTRFCIHTNELPRLSDNSGALLSRMIILTLTKSFIGQEDLSLKAKLKAELPGILRWSIEGLHRLRERGYFVQPESAIELINQMQELSSPLSAFIADHCTITDSGMVGCTELYETWCEWCKQHGVKPKTTASLGRDLHAAIPRIKTLSLRVGHDRQRYYQGIKLNNDGTPL